MCGFHAIMYPMTPPAWNGQNGSDCCQTSQTAAEEPRRVLGESTTGPAREGTFLVFRQGQWSAAFYVEEL